MTRHLSPTGRLGAVLLAVALAVLAGVALLRFPEHLGLLDWPPHAKAHLVAQMGTTVALAFLSLAVLAGPFWSGKRWAWWCLALVGIAVFGSYWFARATVETDAPWRGGNTTFALLTGGYFTGLALSWNHFFGRNR